MEETRKVGRAMLLYTIILNTIGLLMLIAFKDLPIMASIITVPIALIIMIKYLGNVKDIKNEKIDKNNILLHGLSLFGIGCFMDYFINFLNKLIGLSGYWFTGENLSAFSADNFISFIVILVYVGIVAPIAEEILFRGLILEKLKKFGSFTAVIISAILFGLFHMEFMQIIPAIVAGLFLGIIYIKTNSIKTVIVAHAINNILALVLTCLSTLVNINLQVIEIIALLFSAFVILSSAGFYRKNAYYKVKESKKEDYKIRYYFMSICMVIFTFLSMLVMFSSFAKK